MMKGYTNCGIISTLCGLLGMMILTPGHLLAQPQWSWAKRAGASSDQRGYAITSDSNGNTYTTGHIRGLLNDFDLNLVSSNGADDVFIAKYDVDGNNVWVKHAGGSNEDHARGIAVDAAGNIYVCGDFENNATFYGTPNIVLNGQGSPNVFVAKYDSSGNILWVKRGQANGGFGMSIATNGVNVFVTGTFSGSVTFGALPTLNSAGGSDVFIACYSAATGAENWAIRGGSSGNDEGCGIALDASGIYVCGYYSGNCTFQNMSGTMSSDGGSDIFLVKYNFLGSGTWKRHAGSSGADEGESVCCAGDNVYVGGYFSGIMNMYNGGPVVGTITPAAGTDACILQFNVTTGNYNWVRSENGLGTDKIYAIAPDPEGDIFCTGYFTGTLPFNSGPSHTAVAEDIFVSSYDSLGNYRFGNYAGGSNDDIAFGITAPGNMAAFLTGYFKSAPASFGTSSISTASNEDIFVAHYGCMITPANAGPDQVLCSGTTTLQGNTPVFGNGMWSFVSGSGTILTPTSPSSIALGLNTGSNFLEWRITNSTCISTDTVVIQANANPSTANAGNDQHICSPSSTLNGNTPVIGTGLWTLTLGQGIILNPLSPSTTVSGLAPGVNQFRWAISNLSCPLSIDTVTIIVDAAPDSADAGGDQVLCSDSAFVAANTPTVGSGMWSVVSGGGSVAAPGSANTAISNLTPGTHVLQWTITNGVCPSSSDQLQITIDAVPTISSAGNNQEICSPSTTLNGNTPSTGNGTWSVISGSGSIANPNSPSSIVNGLSTTANAFVWQISNGTCPASSDTVFIVVDSMPTIANAGNDWSQCVSSDTLFGNPALTGTGTWTLISGSGNIENPGQSSTAISGLNVGQNIFQWTISNGTCPASSDQVVITVDDFPTPALAGNDRRTCSAFDSLFGNVPLVGTGMWSLLSGGATIGTPTSALTAISSLAPGINQFEWRIANGTCPASSDTIEIEYNEPPSLPVAGPDILACSHYVIMQAQTPLVGDGVWDPLPGSIAFNDSTNPNASLPYLPDGVWYYTWTTQNGFCYSGSDTVAVYVYSNPSPAYAGSDQLIHISYADLNANVPDTGIGTWTFVQGSGSFESPHDPHTRVYNLLPGVNILRWTTSNGVCNSYDDDLRIEVRTLIVPSGYSPNGDGVNDNFEVTGLDEYASPQLEVFNRWGNVVYTSVHYTNDWNGKQNSGEELPDDVYYYILHVDEQVTYTGYVAIKRSTP